MKYEFPVRAELVEALQTLRQAQGKRELGFILYRVGSTVP